MSITSKQTLSGGQIIPREIQHDFGENNGTTHTELKPVSSPIPMMLKNFTELLLLFIISHGKLSHWEPVYLKSLVFSVLILENIAAKVTKEFIIFLSSPVRYFCIFLVSSGKHHHTACSIHCKIKRSMCWSTWEQLKIIEMSCKLSLLPLRFISHKKH